MKKQYDYIIVGQGLAGSVLAYVLLQQGTEVLVLNEEESGTSSYVAAGLYNPVTGKRMQKTWLAEELFKNLELFYRGMEKYCEAEFLHPFPIYKPFPTAKELNDWMAYSSEEGLETFTDTLPPRSYASDVYDDLGGFRTKKSGFVNVQTLLNSFRSKLKKENRYLNTKFLQEEFVREKDKVRWKDYEAKAVIFCEGHRASQNPFFSWLPFSLTKGEVLTLECSSLSKEVIYNQGVFILAKDDGTFKAGSTYKRNYPTIEPTEEGRADIEARLKKLIRPAYKIVNQEAGVRPTITDRRPLAGVHPEFENVFIFNGLGTKGVTLAPYFAEQFSESLKGETNIHPEADIKRFYSIYYNKS